MTFSCTSFWFHHLWLFLICETTKGNKLCITIIWKVEEVVATTSETIEGKSERPQRQYVSNRVAPYFTSQDGRLGKTILYLNSGIDQSNRPKPRSSSSSSSSFLASYKQYIKRTKGCFEHIPLSRLPLLLQLQELQHSSHQQKLQLLLL